jgi:GT2 family glycosyltransferase
MMDLCIVNYKTPKHLERLINVLISDVEDFPPWKLYIANNGDDQESYDILEAVSSMVEKLEHNPNIGYSAACNQLASYGDSEFLALLNADVWMKTRDIARIEEIMKSDESIAVLGPKQMNERSEIVHAGIVGSNTKPVHRGWKSHDRSDEFFKDTVDCVTVSGSAYFVRRSIWEEMNNCSVYRNSILEENDSSAGPFLPTPHYYEETWFSYHVRSHGYRVVYDGSVTIGHSWHASSPVGGEADRHFMTSRGIFRRACDIHDIKHD